jgi:hypothetical protein
VTQDRQGRFLVRSSAFDDILVFDSNGELTTTARTAGAPRFEAIGTFALGPDDRIWAHDYRAGRVVILDRALTVKRTIVSSFGPTIVTADENWIVNAQIQDAALIGFPIHLANPEGTVLRSFGIDVPQYRSDIRLLATRLVSPASDHTIWSVAPGRYVVERWDPDTGELRQQIPVDSEWFKESARLTPDERERPNPVIESIWEQDGLLWLVIRDADLRWEVPERANEERPHDPDEYERTYDWVVEALDPSDGTVIASRRFTQGLWARPGRLLASLVWPESIMLPVATGTIETCELACWDGPCDPGEHDAFDTLDPGTWDAIRNGGAHHTEPLCRSGTCDTKHGPLPCDPYVDLPQGRVDVLQALRVAVLASDPETVAQIIAHGGDRVALNASRSAVQVTGCRGGIVAHLPLSADFLGLVKLAASGDDD